jgi:hypothetical protein
MGAGSPLQAGGGGSGLFGSLDPMVNFKGGMGIPTGTASTPTIAQTTAANAMQPVTLASQSPMTATDMSAMQVANPMVYSASMD